MVISRKFGEPHDFGGEQRLADGDESMRQPLLTTMAGVAAGVQSVG